MKKMDYPEEIAEARKAVPTPTEKLLNSNELLSPCLLSYHMSKQTVFVLIKHPLVCGWKKLHKVNQERGFRSK
ncbi:2453_t:CDS:2 [Paraglomus brasilianum]|uniref:2453_t:CDS:1 n=1 Tax=Paraglomus brasilianum TaxID=144538 RepID=A0A9N9F3Z9_9GLOM|nr:2453_t:CDS:2 [Paraglomus brasilianum]